MEVYSWEKSLDMELYGWENPLEMEVYSWKNHRTKWGNSPASHVWVPERYITRFFFISAYRADINTSDYVYIIV